MTANQVKFHEILKEIRRVTGKYLDETLMTFDSLDCGAYIDELSYFSRKLNTLYDLMDE